MTLFSFDLSGRRAVSRDLLVHTSKQVFEELMRLISAPPDHCCLFTRLLFAKVLNRGVVRSLGGPSIHRSDLYRAVAAEILQKISVNLASR